MSRAFLFKFYRNLFMHRLAASRPHENPRRKCFGERIVIFRSRSGWASDKVARGRLVSLARFSFASRAKRWMTSFTSPALDGTIPRKQSSMFVAKCIRNKNQIKRKLISISSRRLERRSPVVFFVPTLCAVICADRNEKLIQKIHK